MAEAIDRSTARRSYGFDTADATTFKAISPPWLRSRT
jgi:hypothetical protein